MNKMVELLESNAEYLLRQSFILFNYYDITKSQFLLFQQH